MVCNEYEPISDTNITCSHYLNSEVKNEGGICKLPNIFRCPDELDKLSIKISHSSLQSYLQCNKLFYFHKVLGFNAYDYAKSGPLQMGSMMDMVIDNKYKEKLGIEIDKDSSPSCYANKNGVSGVHRAKVNAISRAMDIFVDVDVNNFTGLQSDFKYHLLDMDSRDCIITGKYDALYTNYFLEYKFTSSPQNYLDRFLIASQVGTYFLVNDSVEYCKMMVIQVPAQRLGKNESDGEYENRIYSDILSRPSEYFIGLDRENKTFGVKFYRSDFDLPEIERRYRIVLSEIRDKFRDNRWYIEEKGCVSYGKSCDYRSICETNAISEAIYYQDISSIDFISDEGREYVKQLNDNIDRTVNPYQVAIIDPTNTDNITYIDDYRRMRVVNSSDSDGNNDDGV